MKPDWKRPLWLVIPLTLSLVALCGLLYQKRIIVWLGAWDGARWLPLVLCAVVFFCALSVTAFLLRLNHNSRRALEYEKENLRRSEELYKIFEDFSDAVVFEADPLADTIRFNPKYREMFGHAPVSNSLKSCMAAFVQLVGEEDRPQLDALMNAYRHQTRSCVSEFRMRTGNTPGIWYRLEYRMLVDGAGEACRVVGKLTNIDREKRSLQRLRTKAESDSLTGLLNHETTRSSIEHILTDEGYGGDHALLVIDIDDFKRVNDDFGHPEGDRMIRQLSETIRSQFRASDIAGRVGGDEFIVFVGFTATETLMRAKAAELSEKLQYLCVSDTQERTVTCSIGVALTYGRPMSFEALFREADAALYRAKSAGKNGYQLFMNDAKGSGEPGAAEPPSPGAASVNFQLRALLEYMEGGVLLYEIGEQLRVIYSSPSYHKMVRAQQPAAADSRAEYQYVYGEDEPRLDEALRAGASTGEVVDMVYRVRAEDGGLYWRHIRAVRIPYKESAYPVLIAVITDVTALKEQEKKLLDNEQLLKLALEQTDLRIWTYDLKRNELSGPKLDRVYQNLPECNIESGLTHPDSAEEYRAFYRRILAGEPFGSCVVRQCLFGPQYEWLRLSYRNLYDENGLAYQAIGVTEPLPSIGAAKARFEQEERFLASIAGKLLMTIRYNLTQDRMEAYWLARPERWKISDPQEPHALLDALHQLALTAQDKRTVLERMSTREQIATYRRGEETDTVEFRIAGEDGEILWVSQQNVYLIEPVTGDLCVIGFLRNIDKRKRWELSLPQHIERDAATGLLTRRIAEALARRILRAEKRRARPSALILLAVDLVEQESGFADARMQERVVAEIGRRLCVAFDGEHIVGRLDSDTLLLFTPDMGPVTQLAERVMEIADSPYMRSLHHERLRCRLGLACGTTDRHSWDMLLSLAEASLTDARRDGGNDRARAEAFASIRHADREAAEWAVLPQSARAGELSPEAERAMLACATAIIRARQPEDALPAMLPAIGAYFGAERAFVLNYREENGTVDAICEWLSPGQERLMDRLQDLPLSALPMAQRACEAHAAVAVDEREAQRYGICVPIEREGRTEGFLCLEHSARGPEDARLIESVIELYLTRVKHRDRQLDAAIHVDALTELTDYEGCRMFAEEMDADTVSSLGVLCLDVNGLNAYNREFGKLYGDKLLKFIARTLLALFPKEQVFRIAGDEFLALALNLTQEAFLRQVTEVSRRCETAFAGAACIGHTWTDGDISFLRQVEHAQHQMLLAKQPYYRRAEEEGARTRPSRLKQLCQFIRDKQFHLYVQPRICLASGACTGAEALVRFYDPEQDLIVTPDMFVPQLEKESIIQILDLHMFELTLARMRRWRSEGRALLPLSVNFSHITALDAETIARMREIQARYDIPPRMIELELSERIGALGQATVINACRPLSQAGYRLALDGFGSAYSNLSMLSAIHFDTLKLDRSIVTGLSSNRMGSLIVENSVRLCRDTGVDCVAMGVETGEQAALLEQLGCAHAQGYYFDKPMPAELFAEKYLPVPSPAESAG